MFSHSLPLFLFAFSFPLTTNVLIEDIFDTYVVSINILTLSFIAAPTFCETLMWYRCSESQFPE